MDDDEVKEVLTFDLDDLAGDLFKNWDSAYLGYNEGYLTLGLSVNFY
jgi:hypothetical protein